MPVSEKCTLGNTKKPTVRVLKQKGCWRIYEEAEVWVEMCRIWGENKAVRIGSE